MSTRSVWGAIALLICGVASAATPAKVTDNQWSARDYDLYAGDFNADGLDDILYVAKSANKPSGIALSDGSAPAIAQQTWASNYLGITWYGNYYKPIIGDFNADGYDDVFMQRQMPGDHYLILTDPDKSKLKAIAQTVPNSYRGQVWSADQHVIQAGDFDGDGRTDLLLQGADPSLRHSIYLADSSGRFTTRPTQTWADGYLGFNWSVGRSTIVVGDFDGDGRDDLFLQGWPEFQTIAYDVPFDVPVWQPGAFAILLAKTPDADGSIFQLASIQQVWDEGYLGAVWSPLLTNVLALDLNGDGRDDLLLQSKFAGRDSYWTPSNIASQFTSLVGLAATNVEWSADRTRLIAANFDGGSVVGLYLQSTTPDRQNSILNSATGSTVTPQPHAMAMLAAPTAQTAVGATGGEFSVDDSGGAAYRIPLRLPPGVAGMTPELALAYNSRGGNGLVGMRFGIAGMSSITRCPTTWAVDGFIDGVDFDANDRFCLDGQRLRATAGLAYEGTVGAEYRTEIQSFQKVMSIGGTTGDPASFTVYTKSGQILTFGTSTDSRVDAQGKTKALAWNLKRIVDQYGNYIDFTYEENTAQSSAIPISVTYGGSGGNEVGRVAFNYESRTDTASGYVGGSLVGNDKRLASIDVYSRPTQAATGAQAATAKVTTYQLAYEQSPVSQQSHLSTITECDSAEGGSQMCFRPTTFTWQHGYRGFTNAIDSGLLTSSTKNLKPIDLKNDGQIDFVFTNNSTWRYRFGNPGGANVQTSLTARNASHALVIDWDSDGYQDLVQKSSGTNLEVIKGTATGLATTTVSTAIPASLVDYDSDTANAALTGDFNGDGRQDLVHVSSTLTSLGELRLNSASGLSNATAVPLANPAGTFDWGRRAKPVVVNFDGDGKDDLAIPADDCYIGGPQDTQICTTYAIQFFSFNATTGVMEPVGSYPAETVKELTALDVNGDGLGDLLYQNGSSWVLLKATGTAGAPYSFAWSASSATYTQSKDIDWTAFDSGSDGQPDSAEPTKTLTLNLTQLQNAEFMDYNRDGRTDVVVAADGYFRALISNGVGFDSRLINTGRQTVNWSSTSTFDVNADGLPDLFFVSSNDSKFKYSYQRGPAASGVIEKIENGLGAVTQIQYGLTTDSNVYKGHTNFADTGLAPAFPYANLGAPLPVVARFSSDNGRTSGTVYTMYEYSGLKVHKQGRGMLGFSDVKSWNDNQKIQTINQYRQDWPYAGMLYTAMQKLPSQTVVAINPTPNLLLNYASVCEDTEGTCADLRPASFTTTPGGIVSKTVNAFAQLADASGAVFPYVLKSEEWVYPLQAGGASTTAWKYTKTEYLNASGGTTSASYDAYGNPYRIKVTVSNGSGGDAHTTDTQNYFENNAPGWILGRLRTAKVTHTRATYAGSSNSAPTSRMRVSAFTYNAQGSIATEESEPANYIDPVSGSSVANPNGTSFGLLRTYSYDATGNRTSEVVSGAGLPVARTTSTNYDLAGQYPVSVTNSVSHSETQVWDPRYGQRTSITGPNGLTTTWQYDTFGRETLQIAPRASVQSTTSYHWCSLSGYCTDARAVYAIRHSSTDGSASVVEYDRLGREVRSHKVLLDGREAFQDRYFDPLGRDYLVTAPYFFGETPCYTFRRYDALGRVFSQWNPIAEGECVGTIPDYSGSPPSGGQTTSYQYDEVAGGAAGLITTISTSQAGAASRVVTRQVNVMGRLRFLKDVVGASTYATEYDYDPVGNTSWVKDAAGNQTSLGYDVRGFKVSMNDPDMGSWTYGYDALGELTSQTDAKGQITTLGYDTLGRMTSRVEKSNGSTTESTTNWYYDETAIGGARSLGKLTRVVVGSGGYAGSTGYEEQYVYDPVYGDLSDAKRRIENEWYWISQTYDSLGRLDVLKYPNSVSGSTASSAGADSERLRVKHNYNATGYLTSVSDAASSTVYWTAVSNSAGGSILREDLGNGLSTLRTVDRATGRLGGLTTGVGVSATVQNLEFTWDGAGNLKTRKDNQANKREEFDYDELYRLKQSRLYATAGGTTASSTDNYTYDAIGNLTNKGGAAGAYTYSGYNYGTRTGCSNTTVKPHAVYQVTVGSGTRRYCYDANGNLTNQTIASGTGALKYDSSTWWVANLARRISYGGSASYSDFWYGAGRERIRQVAQKNSTTGEATSYVGGLYEKFTRTVSGTPSTEYVHYVRGGGHAVAVVKRVSGTLQTRYLHRDHLGSVVALTDSAGAVIERYAYDPWGKRRDPASWATPAPGTFSFDPSYSDRGYTGHEHLDHLGLVNMNGRVYDPELGKFLSADPTTQYPESTQGWNRYSYCGNNPLSYTDPSGFSLLKTVMQVVGIILQFIPGFQGWSLVWWQSMLMGFASGFLASGGNLQAGLAGAVGGALFGQISAMKSLTLLQRTALSGLAGGATNAIAGGRFQDGFIGAAASAALMPGVEKLFGATGTGGAGATILRVVSAGVVGGVASALGGGKFQNGAITAAFAQAVAEGAVARQQTQLFKKEETAAMRLVPGTTQSAEDAEKTFDTQMAKLREQGKIPESGLFSGPDIKFEGDYVVLSRDSATGQDVARHLQTLDEARDVANVFGGDQVFGLTQGDKARIYITAASTTIVEGLGQLSPAQSMRFVILHEYAHLSIPACNEQCADQYALQNFK